MGWFSQKKGAEKEQQATQWLTKNGIQILAQNYRCKGGEIDIIGTDKQQTLIFFEVKYRKNNQHGNPLEYISTSKQKKIALCAKDYLLNHPKLQNYTMRFDALSFNSEQTKPSWLQDIFWLN